MKECFQIQYVPSSIKLNTFLFKKIKQICHFFRSSMSSSIKLTYFDARGRAETSRLILAYAGVDYQDERLSSQTSSFMTRYLRQNFICLWLGEQFSELKPSFTYGQVDLYSDNSPPAKMIWSNLSQMVFPIIKRLCWDKVSLCGFESLRGRMYASLSLLCYAQHGSAHYMI